MNFCESLPLCFHRLSRKLKRKVRLFSSVSPAQTNYLRQTQHQFKFYRLSGFCSGEVGDDKRYLWFSDEGLRHGADQSSLRETCRHFVGISLK